MWHAAQVAQAATRVRLSEKKGCPGDENLQNNLDGMKRTLSDTCRRTGIEFLCFRVTKEKGVVEEYHLKASARGIVQVW
jgi:hypothetical protein